MNVEKIEYLGWKNCYKIQYQHIQCIVTSDVGPRIISLKNLANGNDTVELMGFNKDQLGQTGGSDWKLYGGHRLWAAPENVPRTYYPDNTAVQVEVSTNSVKFISSPEVENNIRKTISIKGIQQNGQAALEVEHSIENIGRWPFEMAPWAVSALAVNSVAVIPLSTDNPSGVLPRTSISLWNYSKLNDTRLKLGNRYILAEQRPGVTEANKIGSRVNNGWTCAVNKDTLFVKLIDKNTDNLKVDFGANVETYIAETYMELETIGHFGMLEPGQNATLVEKWFLFKATTIPKSDEDVDNSILPIINSINN